MNKADPRCGFRQQPLPRAPVLIRVADYERQEGRPKGQAVPYTAYAQDFAAPVSGCGQRLGAREITACATNQKTEIRELVQLRLHIGDALRD
jgi:hypothetical protein